MCNSGSRHVVGVGTRHIQSGAPRTEMTIRADENRWEKPVRFRYRIPFFANECEERYDVISCQRNLERHDKHIAIARIKCDLLEMGGNASCRIGLG